MPESETDRPTITFLDTNALHYACLYLTQAKRHGLPPLGNCDGDLEGALQEITATDKMLRDLERGAWTIKHLHEQCREDPAAFAAHSCLSRMEFASGRLRGRAIVNAADPGMPERWWTRLCADEIRLLLSPDDHVDVTCPADALELDFSEAGVRLYETSPERMAEALRLAEQVLSRLYMETNDTIIYAAAVVMGAEEFVSYDEALRAFAECIADPTEAPAGRVRQQFQGARQAILGFLTDPASPSDETWLPTATHGKAKQWRFTLDTDGEELQ